MNLNKAISGPFGSYSHSTFGAILNAARDEGIPLHKVEDFTLGIDSTINVSGKMVGRYRWFNEINRPLFRWFTEEFSCFNEQRFELNPETGEVKPKFKLNINCHDMSSFEISGNDATPEIHEFLHGMLTNYMLDPRYEIHQNAGAFFQGGSHDPNCKWFMIEFWKPAGAQAFIDYMNEHYRPNKKE